MLSDLCEKMYVVELRKVNAKWQLNRVTSTDSIFYDLRIKVYTRNNSFSDQKDHKRKYTVRWDPQKCCVKIKNQTKIFF